MTKHTTIKTFHQTDGGKMLKRFTRRPQSADARQWVVEGTVLSAIGLLNSVDVRITNNPKIIITAYGDSKTLQQIQVSRTEDATVVASFYPEQGSGFLRGMRRWFSQSLSHPHFVIEVPQGTPVRLGILTGQCTIGATHGPLEVLADGATITAERLGSAQLTLHNNTIMTATAVWDELHAQCSGSSQLVVQEGFVRVFEARCEEQSFIDFQGFATAADITAFMGGRIDLREATETLDIRCHIRSRVIVGDGLVGRLYIAATEHSTASFSGKAHHGELHAQGGSVVDSGTLENGTTIHAWDNARVAARLIGGSATIHAEQANIALSGAVEEGVITATDSSISATCIGRNVRLELDENSQLDIVDSAHC